MIGKRIVIPIGRYVVPKLSKYIVFTYVSSYEILHSTPGYTGLCLLKYRSNTSAIVIPVKIKFNHHKFSIDMMVEI